MMEPIYHLVIHQIWKLRVEGTLLSVMNEIILVDRRGDEIRSSNEHLYAHVRSGTIAELRAWCEDSWWRISVWESIAGFMTTWPSGDPHTFEDIDLGDGRGLRTLLRQRVETDFSAAVLGAMLPTGPG